MPLRKTVIGKQTLKRRSPMGRQRINFAPLPPIPATDRGTYIQIVECGRPIPRGVSILPPGQSECTDSPHFGDQRELAGWFMFKEMGNGR